MATDESLWCPACEAQHDPADPVAHSVPAEKARAEAAFRARVVTTARALFVSMNVEASRALSIAEAFERAAEEYAKESPK